MATIVEKIAQLAVAASMDDISFPIVLNAARDVDNVSREADDTLHVMNFVAVMLDHGFVPVTSPYDDPPSVAWPEDGKDAILRRLRREWDALDHEVTFLDLCWFHRPAKAATPRA